MPIETVKEHSNYQEVFRALHDGPERPSWLRQLRQNAMDVFEGGGFPSVKHEEWKYTNVAPIARMNFQPDLSSTTAKALPTPQQLAPFLYRESQASQLVFVNNRIRKELSSLDAVSNTVVVTGLQEALVHERYGEIIRQYLARNADYIVNSFTALNTAFISQGAFVLIPRNVELDTPIHLLFLTEQADAKPAIFPRVLVVAEENSAATLIESYGSTDEGHYFTNAVVEIVLKTRARLNHYKVQREGLMGSHVATTAANLGNNSFYDSTTVTLGAELSRHDISVIMEAEGAECRLDGLYLVGNAQHTDTHSLIDHKKPFCTSRQLYKGILDGRSRAVFNGKIFVRHNAQKTDAMQTNKNLLLSDDARVDTKPQLEILADDVKCAHGAAVGRLDAEELFYLRSRGLEPQLARNLLTYGFAEEVLARIQIGSLKTQLDEAVLHRLHASIELER